MKTNLDFVNLALSEVEGLGSGDVKSKRAGGRGG